MLPVENSHQPTRQRERRLKRFKSLRQVQQFLSAHGPNHRHSHPRRHLMNAAEYPAYRTQVFKIWKRETCIQVAA
jgi:putative transposase